MTMKEKEVSPIQKIAQKASSFLAQHVSIRFLLNVIAFLCVVNFIFTFMSAGQMVEYITTFDGNKETISLLKSLGESSIAGIDVR